MKNKLLIFVLMLAVTACNGVVKPAGRTLTAFPRVEVPSMITDPAEKLEYSVNNWWNGFFAMTGVTDTGAVNGVAFRDVEKALSQFLTLLDGMEKERGAQAVGKLFSQIEAKQAQDTMNHVFTAMTDLVVKYLYDPNSPFRDEDLYLPFVSGMAQSVYTNPDARPGYEFEKSMCSLNPYGSLAPDFVFTDIKGARHRMHDVKAECTLLFFSNPGCSSCKDMIAELEAVKGIRSLISSGKLAVVNIYIDNEIDKWKEYAPGYPADWMTGYDQDGIIREDVLYNVRAIPSLYVLDAGKRVLMKDVPTEKAVKYIESL